MLKVKKLIGKIAVWIYDNLVLKEYNYGSFGYDNGFTPYTTSSTEWTTPKATKCGRIVTLNGAYKNTSQIASGKLTYIGRVPTGCEPYDIQIHIMNPTSTVNRFLMRIYTDGRILVERYGTSTNIAIPANTRLTLNISYISKS